jgi:serpin B
MRLAVFFTLFLILLISSSNSFAQGDKAQPQAPADKDAGAAAAAPATPAAPEKEKPAPTPEALSLAKSYNEVALSLYQKIGADGNIFISPLSISSALSMAYAGAKGGTQSEFERALKYPLKGEDFFKAAKSLSDTLLNVSEGGPQFTLANSLWPDLDIKILGSFLATMNEYFGPLMFPVDYKNDEPGARAKINTWVEDATNGKIVDFLKSPLSKMTRLILVNAVYFKGTWKLAFDKAVTTDQDFQTPQGAVKVPTMNKEASFNYFEDPHLQVLELFYVGNDTSMVVLLPKKDSSNIAALEEGLSVDNITKWTGSFKSSKVNVYLPRFKMTWGTTSLLDPLKSLGLKDAFTDKADFSGITGENNLSISDVVHKAFVEVNEEGTEAAAATGAIMRTTAIAMGPTPEFRADHPFIFLIVDKATGTILFMGKVSDPTKES